jgi:hypothetical protein
MIDTAMSPRYPPECREYPDRARKAPWPGRFVRSSVRDRFAETPGDGMRRAHVFNELRGHVPAALAGELFRLHPQRADSSNKPMSSGNFVVDRAWLNAAECRCNPTLLPV